jgi:murein DD-endopeptidase MepM/ murein hydrolase activator NlpD
MKAFTAAVAAATVLLGVVALLLLPLLFAAAAPIGPCGARGGPVSTVLATIRQLESGGDYTAHAPGSSASGAYQFLDTTWNRYGGYTRAADAPPDTQDAKATEHVAQILDANNNDVAAVPVVWYIGHLPPLDSPEWDTVPAPGAGNTLTPRQYQQRWLTAYQQLLDGDTSTPTGGPPGQPAPRCQPGTSGEVLPGGWALPGPADVVAATVDQLNDPHHDYPAWDWLIPAGTPVYAIRGGKVIGYSTNNSNSYGDQTKDACGVGLTILDDQNTQWTYCHGSAHNVDQGDTVEPGQQILTSGNTGASTAPHVHIQITTNGTKRCPQPLIQSLYQNRTGISPTDLPTTGCTY